MSWWKMVIILGGVTMSTSTGTWMSHKQKSPNKVNPSTGMYQECPELYEHVFRDSVPRANLSAGVYSRYTSSVLGSSAVSFRECVLACCLKHQCNVVLVTSAGDCYHIACTTNELCLPEMRTDSDNRYDEHEEQDLVGSKTSMVLVRPVDLNGPTWTDIIHRQGSEPQTKRRFHDASDSLWQMSDDGNTQRNTQSYEEIDRSDNTVLEQSHRMPYSNNIQNEVDMVPFPFDSTTQPTSVGPMTEASETSQPPHPVKPDVIVDSKVVQLPENNVTLEAHVAVSDELHQSPVSYQYEWVTLQQPESAEGAAKAKGGTGAVRSQIDNKLILSHLSEGVYMFNVTVTNVKLAIGGWTLANVTVLGAARVNAPPLIVITPSNQTVRLPNTAAILDASATIDDRDTGDRLHYHWELQAGPLGYQPLTDTDTATLQLTDLTRPGEYTFQVSATDGDGAQSQALAYLTVLPPTDYPPTADAGPDQVLYLPFDDGELVLSGNGSSDDHSIVSWEWTRINSVTVTANTTNTNATTNTATATDTNMQAVDMRDTRTPTLRLGRIIEPGVYTFQLRVEDASNQTSSAQVRLFVKEKDEQKDMQLVRPLAVVHGNGNVTLPSGQTWLSLDATNSTVITIGSNANDTMPSSAADRYVLYYRWELTQSPSDGNVTVQIADPQSALTNVTGLTIPGFYQFRVRVTLVNDTAMNDDTSSNAMVNVTVTETVTMSVTAQSTEAAASSTPRRNVAPHAVATIAESNVQLPRNAIYLNASQSTDDDMITSYMWKPCTMATATATTTMTTAALGIGAVAEGTDTHPVLVLLLASVRYVPDILSVCWNVTVCDAAALCDSQALHFNVLPDAMLEYMVEMLIGGGPTSVTVDEYVRLVDALQSMDAQRIQMQVQVRPTVDNIGTAGYSLLTVYATTSVTAKHDTNNDNDNGTTTTTTIVPTYLTAGRVVNYLRRTLATLLIQHELQLEVVAVRPVSCSVVSCSGHGHCDPDTRTCHCQSLWMPNLLAYVAANWDWDLDLDWDRDCSWSVLYVTLASIAIVSVAVCIVYVAWNVLCCKYCSSIGGAVKCSVPGIVAAGTMHSQQRQRFRRRLTRNNHSYTLIDNATAETHESAGEGGGGGGGGANGRTTAKRACRNNMLLHSDSTDTEDRTDTPDSDRDDKVLFKSVNRNTMQYNSSAVTNNHHLSKT